MTHFILNRNDLILHKYFIFYRMRFRFYFLLLLLFFSKLSFAVANDSINVCGKFIRKNEFLTGRVCQFGIDKHCIANFQIKDDKFSFSLPSSTVPGVYRLHFDSLSEKPYVDIIIDGIEKSIVFDISIYGFNVFPIFHNSDENQNWYGYLEKSKKMIERLDVLFNYLSAFHLEKYSTDRAVTRVYQKERKQYYNLFDEFVKTNEKRWCGLLVKNRPYYYSDLYNEPKERDFIRLNFYWEGIDTNNLKLINTPLYEELVDLYLEKYLNPIESYNNAHKEYKLKKGLEVLIEKFSKEVELKQFIQDHLKEFFKRLGRQELVYFIEHKSSLN